MTVQDTIETTREVLEKYEHEVTDAIIKIISGSQGTKGLRLKYFNGRTVSGDGYCLTLSMFPDDGVRNYYWGQFERDGVIREYLLYAEDFEELKEALIEIDGTAVAYNRQ
jgi:hypothetical protein